ARARMVSLAQVRAVVAFANLLGVGLATVGRDELVALAERFDAVLRQWLGPATLARVRELVGAAAELLDAGRAVTAVAVAGVAVRGVYANVVGRVEQAAAKLAGAGLGLLAADVRGRLDAVVGLAGNLVGQWLGGADVKAEAATLPQRFTRLAELAERLVAQVGQVRAQLNALSGRPRTGRL